MFTIRPKGVLFFLGLFLFLSSSAFAAYPRAEHLDLKISLIPAESRLSGTAEVRVSPNRSDVLEFELSRNAQVTRVRSGGSPRAFTFKEGRLRVFLEPEEREKEISVLVEYSATFRDSVPESPIYADNLDFGVTGIVSEKGSFLLEGSGWYPQIPGSRPTYRLEVEAPEGILAVSEGKSLGHETRGGKTFSAWEVDFPLEGLSLSAGPYLLREKTVNGISIYTYFLARDQGLSESYLDATARYLVFYENLFGPYPFTKFAVVENFFPAGYGFPSYTLLGSTIIRLPFIIETSLGHEIAHSWWGNSVLVDYRQGNWCEGLTTYVADYLYKENSSAEEAKEYRLQVLRDYSTLVNENNDFPLVRFKSRHDPASQAIGYGKGAMVFHMIRRKLGDKAFWGALRDVYKERRFQETSWRDFQKAFERRGECSLQEFFDQWLLRKGAPQLSLDSPTAEPFKGLYVVKSFLLQKKPFFNLELTVRLESESLKGHKTVNLSGPATFFEVPSFGRPLRLLVDPDFDVFRRLSPSEIPPTINSIKASPFLLLVFSKRWARYSSTLGKMLALSLGVKNYRIIPEQEVNDKDLKSHDLLFVGLPQASAIPASLPTGLVLQAKKFILQGQTFALPSEVFFGVYPHSIAKDRVVAVFLPLSSDRLEEVARKISHYGRYSYLVFREGKNEVKGTWPVRESPLIYSWKWD
jgi:Peptidase family M1 domain